MFVFLLPAAGMPGNLFALFGVGIVLMIAGIVLRWYAIRTLGRFFTFDVAVDQNHRVVDTGPYRYIRHPAYTGNLLTFVGLGLALGNWASLAVILILSLPGMAYRIRVEEDALATEIGQPYRDYMRRTRRLIPFLF